MRNYLAKIGSVLLLVGVLVGAMWLDRANNTAPTVNVVVKHVIDGDTIDVLIDLDLVRVRPEGIDAPELSQVNGIAAQQFLIELIQGNTMHLAVLGQDKYGRTLGTVFMHKAAPLHVSDVLATVSVNELLVGSGMAWAYRYRGEVQNTALGDLEAQARTEKRGLWANAAAVEPWQWRQSRMN